MFGGMEHIKYTLYNNVGIPELCSGGYLIVDGGYPKETALVDPIRDHLTREILLWSEWLESVRKDVECTFGILKGRFQILKKPIQFKDAYFIEFIFKSCAILHNIILEFDKLSISSWEYNVEWHNLNPENNVCLNEMEYECTDTNENLNDDLLSETDDIVFPTVSNYACTTQVHIGQNENECITKKFIRGQYKLFKDCLVNHFSHQYRIGEVYWPKGFSKKQCDIFPIVTNYINRIRTDLFQVLYAAPSTLRSKVINETGREEYSGLIGHGLFSQIIYKKDDAIVEFMGEIIAKDIFKARESEDKGGYGVYITTNEVLDCFNHRHVCMGSYANDPKNCFNTFYQRLAIANCYTSTNYKTKTVTLKAKTNIRANVELLWSYGPTSTIELPIRHTL
jgi:hypothetical protein